MGELREIYDQDQRDRRGPLREENLRLRAKRDSERLARVLEIIEAGSLRTGEDYLCAAMVLQHSGEIRHYKMAHEFAKKAADLGFDPGDNGDTFPHPLWLAAAAKDRFLSEQGRPQLYGTQLKNDTEDGSWYLCEVDPNVTDEERARWHVPPLAEAMRKVKKMNENRS